MSDGAIDRILARLGPVGSLVRAVVRAGWKLRVSPPVIAFRRLFAGDNSDVKWRWTGPPPPFAERVCIFVTCLNGTEIPERALSHARRWADAGYGVIFVAVSDDLGLNPVADFGHVMVRENKGHDFGAWATAITALPWLRDSRVLVTANDSVYGPGDGFDGLLERALRSEGDVVGVTESRQVTWHLQSYLLFFKQPALRHPGFWDFWRGVRIGGRQHVIDSYELRLARHLRNAGLAVEALFPASIRQNPLNRHWSKLIADGFPYVKRKVLNSLDPDEWRPVLIQHGFDIGIIERDVGGPCIRSSIAADTAASST